MSYNLNIKNYSTYSKQFGFLKIDDILSQEDVEKSKKAFITDYATLSGVPEFVVKSKKMGITPIIGVSFDLYNYNQKEEKGEITLYANNEAGYENLKRIVSLLKKIDDNVNKKYLDINELQKFSHGVSLLTGGENSYIGMNLKKNKKAVYSYVNFMKDIYKDSMFLEIQNKDSGDNDLKDRIIKISKYNDLSLLATNDNRFKNKNQYELLIEKAKKILGVKSKLEELSKINEEDFQRSQKQNYGHYFRENKECLNATKDFAKKFNGFEIFKTEIAIPKTNADEDLRSVLRGKYKEFIKNIHPSKRDVYKKRIREEIDIIEDLDFGDYFLIFENIISNKKELGFSLRGSSVGSLVVHVLGMSDIDPIENGLLFERFLNKGRGERKELPDIDLETTDKDEVLSYLNKFYGKENSAMLMVNNEPKVKGQIEFALNVLKNHHGYLSNESIEKDYEILKNAINKNFGSSTRTMSEEIIDNRYLQKLKSKNNNISKIINVALEFENQILSQRRSSASLVIANNNILNYFSTQKDESFVVENVIESTKENIEDFGLIKLDVLSNKYLEKTLKAFRENNIKWNIKKNDDKVFKLISNGHTVSLNQLKNPKQAQLCKEIGIDNFKDLVAVIALLRPGISKDDRELFAKRKNSGKELNYSHPKIKNILEETQGIVIYDEQIMRIVQDISGFSPEESDYFRSLIKKNKIDEIKSYKEKIIKGALENGIEIDVAKKIYQSLENISGKYTFTKAHATAYADLIYKQAYFKEYLPSEYMEYFLSDKNEYKEYVKEVEERGLILLNVDINRSVGKNRTIKSVRTQRIGLDFSMSVALNKSDDKFVNTVLSERETGGVFTNLSNFIERVLPAYSGVSLLSPEWKKEPKYKKDFILNVKNLIEAGSFDSIMNKESMLVKMRNELLESVDVLVESSLNPFAENKEMSLVSAKKIDINDVIKKEHEIYGFSVSEKKREKITKQKLNNN